MKRDPVCNLSVDESIAIPLEENGKIFYFCSVSCRNRFLQEGEQKVTPGAKTERLPVKEKSELTAKKS